MKQTKLKHDSKEVMGYKKTDPMDCSPPGPSVHGIFQARILEWVAFSFSRGSSPTQRLNLGLPRCRFFTVCATREAPTDCALLPK